MGADTSLSRYIHDLPLWFLFLAVPALLALTVLTIVRVYTTRRYHQSLSAYSSSDSKATKATPPPPIPYTIPFLGHAISFLAPRPGEFWAQLFRSLPRATGVCTLLLGGRQTHILFSPSAVQALFKARGPARHGFNMQIAELGLGIEYNEAVRYYGNGEGPDHTGMTPVQQQERMNHHYLLEKKSVNELTAGFTKVLQEQLSTEELPSEGNASEGKEVRLYAWLQERLFKASTTAFMGSRILEVYPNLREDFFDFDRHMLTMFFRVPKFLSPTPYNVRERALDGLIRYQQQMQTECHGHPAHPDGNIDWEPIYGSRANRARQCYYASRGLNLRTRAGMDLGFLFGLSSNAIPAAGWMLMHILDPHGNPTLYPRVMAEISTAERPDGTLDIPTLTSLPLLQSIYHETLRLYVDVLVTRELAEDLTLPLTPTASRSTLLRASSIVFCPSWLGHRDPSLWNDPPAHIFHAERFLTASSTDKPTFSTEGTTGKLFPFGGGKTMCPGRVFAKQEVLASAALVLRNFEFEVLGYVDEGGKGTSAFPGLRKSYAGSGIMAAEGDVRVRMRRRAGGG